MTDPKHDIIAAIDIPAALGLLTRLPIRIDTEAAMARGPASAWAYPLAGTLVATIAASIAAAFLWLGVAAPLAAAILLATQIILTGAMHEDGLADTADGLWGGWTPERRLAIMKDSQIGTYGTLALILSILARWSALTTLLPLSPLAAPIVAASFSRAPMVALMANMQNARSKGLSHSVGRPSPNTAWRAIAVAVAIAALLTGPTIALVLTVVLATTAAAVAAIAHQKIQGQTGDILGATQQLCEIAALCTLTTLLI